MRNRYFAFSLVAVLIVSGCASVSLPKVIPSTMEAVCGLYGEIKPHYPELKAYVVEHREEIEKRVPGVWDALVTIDKYAADLDRGLSILCAPDGDANAHVATDLKSRVPWDKIGAAVVKLATVAIQAKYSNG